MAAGLHFRHRGPVVAHPCARPSGGITTGHPRTRSVCRTCRSYWQCACRRQCRAFIARTSDAHRAPGNGAAAKDAGEVCPSVLRCVTRLLPGAAGTINAHVSPAHDARTGDAHMCDHRSPLAMDAPAATSATVVPRHSSLVPFGGHTSARAGLITRRVSFWCRQPQRQYDVTTSTSSPARTASLIQS